MERSFRPAPSRAIEVVFFDVGGTLLHVRPSVGHVYADAVRSLGYPVEPEEINRSFRIAWVRSLARRRAADYASGEDILKAEWRIIVAESFDGLVPAEVAASVFEGLYERFSGPQPWSLAPGALTTLEALRVRGLKLGVLSNWDSRLPETLSKLGIRSVFDHLVVSYEVGVEKPHRRIFEEATRRAGVGSGASLLVGDSLEQDIFPALRLGWQALWLSPSSTATGGAPVDRIGALPEVLERI